MTAHVHSVNARCLECEAPPATTSLFVYGTLRPTARRQPWAFRDLSLVARPATLTDWTLYGAGERFPYAIPGGGTNLYGDLLTFTEQDWPDALWQADQIEGYPSHYTRHHVRVHTSTGPAWAWVYTPADDWLVRDVKARMGRIDSGDWFVQ